MAPGIQSMITVGSGRLIQERVRPAMEPLARCGRIGRAVFLDVQPKPTFPLRQPGDGRLAEEYLQIKDSLLPFDQLNELGCLGRHTLAYVASPTPFHVLYAKQLLGTGCRIAVEKPLTHSTAEARSLLGFDRSVFPVSHYLFKRSMLSRIRRFRSQGLARPVAAVQFDLMETAGPGGRAIDSAVWDQAWHGFECIRSLFRAASREAELTVTGGLVAAFRGENGHTGGSRATAALIEGFVWIGTDRVRFLIRVGKGLAAESKQLLLRDTAGGVDRVDLAESGWRPYYRLLEELLTARIPDLQLPLPDHIDVVSRCLDAERVAMPMPAYQFGTTPRFLLQQIVR